MKKIIFSLLIMIICVCLYAEPTKLHTGISGSDDFLRSYTYDLGQRPYVDYVDARLFTEDYDTETLNFVFKVKLMGKDEYVFGIQRVGGKWVKSSIKKINAPNLSNANAKFLMKLLRLMIKAYEANLINLKMLDDGSSISERKKYNRAVLFKVFKNIRDHAEALDFLNK